MKKGFTLIELLAVIIILGILIALVAPQVVNNIQDSKDKAYDVLIKSVESATELYIVDHLDEVPDMDSATPSAPVTFEVTLYTLVNYEYIDEPVKNPLTDEEISLLTPVEVTATAPDTITTCFALGTRCD